MKTGKHMVILTGLVFLLFVAPLSAHAASSAAVKVTAVIRAMNECLISSGNLDLDFGLLDPDSPVDRQKEASIVFRCAGNTGLVNFTVSEDGGRRGQGGSDKRMKHTEYASFLPYRLRCTPESGAIETGIDHTLNVSGTLLGEHYRDVSAGQYEDTVTITITP
jgi:spore coat protein U-like protein